MSVQAAASLETFPILLRQDFMWKYPHREQLNDLHEYASDEYVKWLVSI